MEASDRAFDDDDANDDCIHAANGDNVRSWRGNSGSTGGTGTFGRGGSFTPFPSSRPNPPLPGIIPTRTTLPRLTSSSTSIIIPPTVAHGGIPNLPGSSTTTSLGNSPTEGLNDTPASRIPLTKSSTSQFMTSVRFTTDPSGTTDITSIGILPSGTTSTTSIKSGSKAGLIAGVVVSILFVIFIIGFLFYWRRVRRRNRVAPSAQYLAEYGDRPLSRGFFFNRRGNSRHPDTSHGSIWQERNSVTGHSHAPESQTPGKRAHRDEPEMGENQGHTNVRRRLSISGKTSIGAAAGHSAAREDPFADDFGAQISTVTGH